VSIRAQRETRLPAEHAGYFEAPGAHLYTVHHRVEEPLARVLLVGPFASERHNSYIPWALWARYLASRGIEVLRFDYRGVGESEGVFEEATFDDWTQDIHHLARWLKEQSPDIPLVLHGLGIGALLASLAFRGGVGQACLLWSPPATANHALRASLIRWVNVDQLFKYGEDRKRPSIFIQELERGSSVAVEGYQWTGRLWRDSFNVCLPDVIEDEATAEGVYSRPVKIVKLGREASPLVYAGTVLDDRAKDFNWLFLENWQWIASSLDGSKRMWT
jgi:alpha/beta superfamily hydrolase